MKENYLEYKNIEIKNIIGIEDDEENFRDSNCVEMEKNIIKMEGIKAPSEAIEIGKKYYILKNMEKVIAAKQLNYITIPCLIKNPLREFISRKKFRRIRH